MVFIIHTSCSVNWTTAISYGKVDRVDFLETVAIEIKNGLNLLNKLSLPSAETSFIFCFSVSLVMLIILSKHWQPFKGLFNKE